MEVEQALDFIRPDLVLGYVSEEGLGPVEGVDDDLRRFAPLNGFQSGIETAQKIVRSAHSFAVNHKVQTGSANQVQPRQVVTSAQHARYSDVIAGKLTQAIQQDFRRAWSA